MFPFAGLSITAPAVPGEYEAKSELQAHSFGVRALTFALWVTIVLSTLEGPVRYTLSQIHLDSIIFLRDALLVAALVIFVVLREHTSKLPVSLAVFTILMGIHSFVSYMNIHSLIPAVYGIKMFLPALCGFLAPKSFFRPSQNLIKLVTVLWIITVTGATLDKFWLDYPWVGLNVEFGDVEVYLGRDWQSGALERVAGLTRSSINLAIILPLLTCILMTAVKSRLLRAILCFATVCVLYWSTQKGAILGFAFALVCFVLSRPQAAAPLKFAVVFSIMLMVFAPTVLIHFEMPKNSGTFSFESFNERISWMWPDAWTWIGKFSPLMGVGMGGIGGAQRFYAPLERNAADSLFIFLFANCGIASIFYLLATGWAALNANVRRLRDDGIAMTGLIFLLMYGVVVTLVEDQIGAMWLGAALGWLSHTQYPTRSSLVKIKITAQSAISKTQQINR